MSQSWENWKQTLAEAVQKGQSMGMSHEQMASRAEQIGDILAQNVDPQNPEQKVLQELWTNANEQEQQALASAIIKMVQN